LKGILIISHGSPEPTGIEPLQVMAHALTAKFTVPIHLAFLDFNHPNIPIGVDLCYHDGVRELLLIPYFLTEGFLSKKSIRIARQAAAAYPDLSVSESGVLAFEERIGEILLDRFQNAF
jgi:sirohydrochlorin cobaltochelatase